MSQTCVPETLTSTSPSSSSYLRMPCIYINHGGGPLPLIGHQPSVANTLRSYSSSITRPKAILIITAHWITNTITIGNGISHPLYFDYGGFPSETYKYKYDAPGSPELADQVANLLNAANIPTKKDSKRGWDHGVFVPLMLLYPEANIPIVAMSLQSSLDPEYHIRVGRALAPLRDEGVLIIGSGAAFHNFDYFFAQDRRSKSRGLQHSRVFSSFLQESLTSQSNLTKEEREQRLINWFDGPSARESQKAGQDEHLIPLHVIAGVGLETSNEPARVFGAPVGDDEFEVPNFEWV